MKSNSQKPIKKNASTRALVQFSLFCTITVILGMTPLGFIPIYMFRITTVHIPVIIGSIMLGSKKGAVLGAIFGATSLITAHISATPMSWFFSPFISGNLLSLVVCFVPRILVGVVPYYVFVLLKKKFNMNISIIVASVMGSLTNTILVLGFIYMFFTEKYAEKLNVSVNGLLLAIVSSTFLNVVLEIIISVIVPLSICKILFKISK